MDKLTQSFEDYLEAIYILETHGERIKSTRIAEHLGVSKPAVNKAMMELADKGMITKESYSDIVLTELGREQAQAIYNKHTLLKELLTKIGVPSDIAEVDSCKIEHTISNTTYICLCELIKKL